MIGLTSYEFRRIVLGHCKLLRWSMTLLASTIGAIAASNGSEGASYANIVAVTSPTAHFQLYELAGANSVIDRIGGKPGFLINQGDIEFRLPTLVQGGAASMAFGAAEDFPGYITVQDLLVGVAELGVAAVVQPDIVKNKHIVITSAEDPTGDDTGGHMSLELVDDNAEGLMVRGWSVDGTNVARVIVGSVGDVTPGEAVHLAYVRQSGSSPSQTIYVNGEVAAQDATTRTWPAMPSSLWHIGAWPGSTGPGDPYDGPISEIVGWDHMPAQSAIQSLSLTQGFSKIDDFEADPVVANTSDTIGIKGRPGVHTKGTLIPSIVQQGSFATATPSGEAIELAAGSGTGTSSFDFRVTDVRGLSNVATVNFDVIPGSTPSSEEPWGGNGVGVFAKSYAYANLPFQLSQKVVIKFVAERTGQVSGVRTLVRKNIHDQTGYSNGDGGRIQVNLHADNGSGQPGTQIGTGEIIDEPVNSMTYSGGNSHDELQLTDLTLPTVTAGQIYHWVFNQLDGGGVFVSINTTRDNAHDYNNNAPGNSGVGLAPFFGNNLGTLRGTSSPYPTRPGYFAVFSTVYSDGDMIGQNIGSIVRTDRKSVDGSNRVRVRMIPTTNRTVNFVYAGCYKRTDQTTEDVTVQVKNNGGTVLASATLPASSIGYDPDSGAASNFTANNEDPIYEAPWVKASLSQQLSLTGGQTYYVEFSAAAGADVWFISMKDLTTAFPHQDPRFPEARGQFSTNGGSSWTDAWDHGAPNSSTVYPVLLHLS